MASIAGGSLAPAPPGIPPPPYDPSRQHDRPAHQPSLNGRSEHRPPSSHRPPSDSTHKTDKHRQGHDKSRSHHDKAHPPSKPKPAPAHAPPTAQPLSTALDARLRRDTPFLATIRFKNDLPEVPGDPKLLVVQQQPEKLATFSLTSIEKEQKHELVLPADVGITLSVLDMERYAVPASKPTLHPDDLKLLGAEADTLLGSGPLAGMTKAILGLQNSPNEKRRGAALKSAGEVSWLMKTTYLSAEAEATRNRREQNEFDARREKMRGPTSEDPEEGDEETQRQAQIRMIEATFAAARAPPVHRTKPNMRAVEVMEFLPDAEWWGHKFMSAHFDRDPSEDVEGLAALGNTDLARQVVSMGVLKGFKLEEEQSQASRSGKDNNTNTGRFMALLLPRDIPVAATTMEEQGPSGIAGDDLEGEYNWAREYSYNLIQSNKKEEREAAKSGLQQSYLVRFQGGKALYCEVKSKLELRSKREGGARSRGANQFQRPSKVVLRKRGLTAKEVEDSKRQCLALSSLAVEEADEGRGGAGEGGDDEQWGS